MQKILSLTQQQILSGITPFKNNARYGIWYDADGLNPAISGGSMSITASPTEIGTTYSGINSFCFSGSYLYGYDSNGRLYQIDNADNLTALRVTDTADPAAGSVESLKTQNSNRENVVYFTLSHIGLYLPATSAFNDTWKTITNGGIQHPVYKVGDRIYFGSKNSLDMLSDDLANDDPLLTEGWFTLPVGENIYGLSHDGTYLIIAADSSNTLENKTVIYFYDADNRYAGANVIYSIQDSIVSIYTKKGITYMVGNSGLWAFSYGSPPEKISSSIYLNTFGFELIDEIQNAILIGGNNKINSYGKLIPEFPNAIFTPISDVDGSITAIASQVGYGKVYFATSGAKLYVSDMTEQKVCDEDVIKTAYLDLSSKFIIERLDIVFDDVLQDGDELSIRVRSSESGVSGIAYSDFNTTSSDIETKQTSSVSLYPKTDTGKITTDKISLEITQTGTFNIRKIEVYGSERR